MCNGRPDPVLGQTALVAEVSWLVTGDQDLLDLPVTLVPEVRIVTPAEAVDLLDCKTRPIRPG
jgi:hypothetical protein